MAAPLARFSLEEVGSGIMPGANAESVPLWTQAKDVVFNGAGVVPAYGLRNVVAESGLWDDEPGNFDAAPGLMDARSNTYVLGQISDGPLRGVWQQVQSDGQRLVVWGTDTKLFVFRGGTTSDVTRVSGAYSGIGATRTAYWSFAQWGDWVLATNGVDKPQVLKTAATNFIDLANFPADSAEIVRVLGAHALFFNLTGTYAPASVAAEEHQFVWSKRDDVEAWDPTVNGNETAGELTVRDAQGGFTCVEPLAQGLVAYTERGAHLITLDDTFFFAVQRGVIGTRVGSKNAVAVVGDVHMFVAEAGIYATDGLTMTPLSFPRLGDWLRWRANWDRRWDLTSLVNMRQNIVQWSIPADNSAIVLTMHTPTQSLAFGTRQFAVACREVAQWPPLVGLPGPFIREVSPDAEGVLAELETKPLALGGRDARAFMDLLMLRHERASGWAYYRVGDTQQECEAGNWTPLGTLSDVETELYIMAEAGYVQFRFEISGGSNWVLSGFEVLGKKAGRRY